MQPFLIIKYEHKTSHITNFSRHRAGFFTV
jgi:hypothetical protein